MGAKTLRMAEPPESVSTGNGKELGGLQARGFPSVTPTNESPSSPSTSETEKPALSSVRPDSPKVKEISHSHTAARGDVFGLLGDPRKCHAKRQAIDIVSDMLQILSEDTTKPPSVLWGMHDNWRVLASSLDFLVSRGIVSKEEVGGRTVYRPTEEGRAELKLFDSLRTVTANVPSAVRPQSPHA